MRGKNDYQLKYLQRPYSRDPSFLEQDGHHFLEYKMSTPKNLLTSPN